MTTTAPTPAAPETRARQQIGTEQLVSFHLDHEEYGVEITKVREIILMDDITRIPQAPDYIKGLINLRNTVIPIVDLRRRFGLPEQEPTDQTRIMVVNVRGKTIGLVVDAVSEVFRIAREQITPPPPTVANSDRSFITGLVKLEKRLVIVLDIDRILGDDET